VCPSVSSQGLPPEPGIRPQILNGELPKTPERLFRKRQTLHAQRLTIGHLIVMTPVIAAHSARGRARSVSRSLRRGQLDQGRSILRKTGFPNLWAGMDHSRKNREHGFAHHVHGSTVRSARVRLYSGLHRSLQLECRDERNPVVFCALSPHRPIAIFWNNMNWFLHKAILLSSPEGL
jgi:hypothetical protein